MVTGKRAGLAAVIAIIAVAGAAFAFRQPIGMWLFERAVEQNVGRNRLPQLPDGLHVALCGTGSPMPSRDRAGPCTLVIAGKAMFVVDAGEGGASNIAQMGLPNGQIRGVFLTHFHSDHIDGMGPMMLMRWVGSGNTAPLPVHGPPGVEAVIAGFNAAYATDNSYRTAHHGAAIAPPAAAGAIAVPFQIPADPVVVYEAGGLTVTAFRVDHDPVKPAVGYRFDYKGRSVVVSGDTAPSPSLVRAASGADLLIHEALQPRMVRMLSDRLKTTGQPQLGQIMQDILNYHSSPAQAAESAAKAGVEMLVLSHIVPPLPSHYFDEAFLGGAEDLFDGPIVIGDDGQHFFLPANSEEIERSDWL